MSSDFENSSYLYGANETYLAQMYARYLEDPSSIDPEWTEVYQVIQKRLVKWFQLLFKACL